MSGRKTLDQLERELALKDMPRHWGICMICQKVVRTPHICPKPHRKPREMCIIGYVKQYGRTIAKIISTENNQ